MLGWFKPKKDLPEVEMQKERKRLLQVMLDKSISLSKLIKANETGWSVFCELIDDYINSMKKYKALTALDKATDAVIQELKYIDHEIYILNWLKRIPDQFIKKVETELEKAREE